MIGLLRCSAMFIDAIYQKPRCLFDSLPNALHQSIRERLSSLRDCKKNRFALHSTTLRKKMQTSSTSRKNVRSVRRVLWTLNKKETNRTARSVGVLALYVMMGQTKCKIRKWHKFLRLFLARIFYTKAMEQQGYRSARHDGTQCILYVSGRCAFVVNSIKQFCCQTFKIVIINTSE